MTLPSSGAMSSSMINVELGRAPTAVFQLTGAAERALAGIPSGAIGFHNFYGKSAGGGGGPPVGTIVYQGAFDGSPSSVAGAPLGTAAAGRIVSVVVHWMSTTAVRRTLSSATIAGVPATIRTQIDDAGGVTAFGVAVIDAVVAAGTTGTISCTFSGAVAPIHIVVHAIYNCTAAVGIDADINSGSKGNLNLTLATGSGSVAVAGVSESTGTGRTWINAANTDNSSMTNGTNPTSTGAGLASGLGAGSVVITIQSATVPGGNVAAGVAYI